MVWSDRRDKHATGKALANVTPNDGSPSSEREQGRRTDHANSKRGMGLPCVSIFFYPSEWIGVIAGAVAFGFLTAQVIVPESRSLLIMNLALMVIQIVVGVLGFALHARGNLSHAAGSIWDRFVYGAPIFAPLLFADLALLAVLGCWGQLRCLASGEGDPREEGTPSILNSSMAAE